MWGGGGRQPQLREWGRGRGEEANRILFCTLFYSFVQKNMKGWQGEKKRQERDFFIFIFYSVSFSTRNSTLVGAKYGCRLELPKATHDSYP